MEPCTLIDSKPCTGRCDANLRVEIVCVNNHRNMERRVQKRKPDDPLRKFWALVIAGKEKFAAWSRKMKKRA